MNNQKTIVTKETIGEHRKKYQSYVLELKTKINMLLVWSPSCIIKLGAIANGYSNYSIECIPVSYNFFAQKGDAIKNLITFIGSQDTHVTYINDGIEQHKNLENKKDELPRILHTKHVQTLTLPQKINKNDLIKNPGQMIRLINNGSIDLEEYKTLVALNLFIQYWQETVAKVYK